MSDSVFFSAHYYICLLSYASGKDIIQLDTLSAVRTCGFSYSSNLVAYSTDKAMGQPSELNIFDMRDSQQVSK